MTDPASRSHLFGRRTSIGLGVASAASLVVLAVLGLVVAPADAEQGDAQRLMYVHVPAAWLAYLAFAVTTLASILYLWPRTRRATWDRIAGASAELGVVFTGLTLVLGSLWGKPIWGVWWTWDARLTSAAVLFVLFLGYLALRRVPEQALLPLLGLVIAGYALYALWGRRPPELRHPAWGLAAGLLAGLLGGAYNTAGPPAIIYGDCRRWPPPEFKSNLQAFFMVSDGLVLLGHAFAGNLTRAVMTHYAVTLPAIVLGLWLGLSLERRIRLAGLRTLALALLLMLGARLIWVTL